MRRRTHQTSLSRCCLPEFVVSCLYLRKSFCPAACTPRGSRTHNRSSGPGRCASSRHCCLRIHSGLHDKGRRGGRTETGTDIKKTERQGWWEKGFWREAEHREDIRLELCLKIVSNMAESDCELNNTVRLLTSYWISLSVTR